LRLIAATILFILASAGTHAQTSGPNATSPQGGWFSNAVFSAGFRKYTPPTNDFSPFYSWDAQMELNVAILQRGRGSLNFGSLFQTVGTENLGDKIGVGGTGYLLELAFRRSVSDRLRVSAGFKHVSTHLTRDLDQKDAEVRGRGMPIPQVEDPSEYNVFFFGLSRRFTSAPLKPELDVVVVSANFRLNGVWLGFVRPLYVGSRWMLREHRNTVIVFETQHEFGKDSFGAYSLRVELVRHGQEQGRFQFYILASPGHDVHVSPNIGGLRDGLAFGLRFRFQA
jgi:hypothetical protein